MSTRRRWFSATRIRKTVQLCVLLLFFGLVVIARPTPGAAPSPLLKSFFLVDPLILIATWLAAHAVPVALLWSLVVIGVTLVLGRVFCGWVCPLGTLHDIAGRVFDLFQPKNKRREHWSRLQLAKYYLLVGFLAMALFGGHWVAIFDPLVLLYRTTTTVLAPGLQWGIEAGSTAIYQADLSVGSWRVHDATEPGYEFLRDHVFVVPKQAFFGSGLIAAVFLLMLVANGYRRRFWCRYLCPLGALLGFFSWRPLLRRTVDKERCNECDLCGMRCHGAASAAPGDRWKPSECLGCLNCREPCPSDSLAFHLVRPWRREPGEEPVDLSKRAMLGAAAAGVAGLAMARANPLARGSRYHPRLIRPPGARPEREFLARCTACGLCMKVCPTGGLQPVLTEAGLEGLWTPRLVPSIGYCEYSCNLCGQVCPTGAIEPLTVEAKQKVKIGLAAFDITRCIPYAYGRDCMVCEEHCPAPEKAIYSLEVVIQDRNGQPKTVKQPHVDPDLCIGCGVCEYKCPYQDQPAIRVSSANESRHRKNQPILPVDPWAFGY